MFKRIFFTLVLMLVLLLVVLPLAAATGANTNILPNLLLIFSPVLIAVASKLTNKLFKKLNIDIEDSILDAIFAELFRWIASAEQKKASLSAGERFNEVVSLAYARMPKKSITLLERRFGSVENAVQAAFEKSSVALKKTK